MATNSDDDEKIANMRANMEDSLGRVIRTVTEMLPGPVEAVVAAREARDYWEHVCEEAVGMPTMEIQMAARDARRKMVEAFDLAAKITNEAEHALKDVATAHGLTLDGQEITVSASPVDAPLSPTTAPSISSTVTTKKPSGLELFDEATGLRKEGSRAVRPLNVHVNDEWGPSSASPTDFAHGFDHLDQTPDQTPDSEASGQDLNTEYGDRNRDIVPENARPELSESETNQIVPDVDKTPGSMHDDLARVPGS